MKSLALASKIKSLASKPQVLENCPVLGSWTALFFKWLKFCRSAENIFLDRFFGDHLKNLFEDLFCFGDRLKKIVEDLFFFGEHLRLCLRSMALVSTVSVLGRAVLGLGLGFFCVLGLGLEPNVLDSTSGW